MFCTLYRSSIFSTIRIICLLCLPPLQMFLLSFKTLTPNQRAGLQPRSHHEQAHPPRCTARLTLTCSSLAIRFKAKTDCGLVRAPHRSARPEATSLSSTEPSVGYFLGIFDLKCLRSDVLYSLALHKAEHPLG